MTLPRLSFLDNYSTTAAGVGGSDNFIEVANVDFFNRCSGRIRRCPGEQ